MLLGDMLELGKFSKNFILKLQKISIRQSSKSCLFMGIISQKHLTKLEHKKKEEY